MWESYLGLYLNYAQEVNFSSSLLNLTKSMKNYFEHQILPKFPDLLRTSEQAFVKILPNCCWHNPSKYSTRIFGHDSMRLFLKITLFRKNFSSASKGIKYCLSNREKKEINFSYIVRLIILKRWSNDYDENMALIPQIRNYWPRLAAPFCFSNWIVELGLETALICYSENFFDSLLKNMLLRKRRCKMSFKESIVHPSGKLFCFCSLSELCDVS